MPFGKTDGAEGYKEVTVENTRSLMHIFGKSLYHGCEALFLGNRITLDDRI